MVAVPTLPRLLADSGCASVRDAHARTIIAQLGRDRHGKARRDLARVERFDVAKLIFDGATSHENTQRALDRRDAALNLRRKAGRLCRNPRRRHAWRGLGAGSEITPSAAFPNMI
uniref:Uncharacterized protein n=1 Tax=Rhizobium rhizogenes TaxID=359 RepID=A0A7S4ZTU1_RHIRH|nr:hypothetical protein pC6.5b_260 [Rhizobium rhizogenes]